MKTQEMNFQGAKCLSLCENGRQAIVTVEVGPRVVFFGFEGGKNHFHTDPAQMKNKAGAGYTMYGGHRLWHAPEDSERTYEADNFPVQVEQQGKAYLFTSPTDRKAGTQKTVQIEMTENGLKIKHTIVNRGLWDIKLSAWGLTVMDVGGLVAVPQNRKNTGLLANRTVGLWPYTRLSDPRLYWGDRYITIAGDAKAKGPLKIGTLNESAFCGYFNHGELFVKTFGFERGAVYPDFNNNFESYSCAQFTEVEALSPLKRIGQNESVVGEEEWFLFPAVKRPKPDDEEAMDAMFNKHGFSVR